MHGLRSRSTPAGYHPLVAVLYSRFPARVETSDGSQINRSAVVAFNNRALLAVTRPGTQPGEPGGVQVIAELTDPVLDQTGRIVVLRGADGQTWRISDGDGCSCRSVLQRWYHEQLAGQPAGT